PAAPIALRNTVVNRSPDGPAQLAGNDHKHPVAAGVRPEMQTTGQRPPFAPMRGQFGEQVGGALPDFDLPLGKSFAQPTPSDWNRPEREAASFRPERPDLEIAVVGVRYAATVADFKKEEAVFLRKQDAIRRLPRFNLGPGQAGFGPEGHPPVSRLAGVARVHF